MYKRIKYFVRKLNWMYSLSTIFSDADFWSKYSKNLSLKKKNNVSSTDSCSFTGQLLFMICLRKSYLKIFLPRRPLPKNSDMNDLRGQICVKSARDSRGKYKSCKEEGNDMWRCDLCWSLLAQLREWWVYYRYGCSSSLSNGNNGKCSVMSVMVPCISSISNSGFPLHLLFFFSLVAIQWFPFITFRGWSCCTCCMDVFHLVLVYFFPFWYILKLPNMERVFRVIMQSILRRWQWKLHAVLCTFFKLEKFGNKWKMGSGLS